MKQPAFAFVLALGLLSSGVALARDPLAVAQSAFEEGRRLEAAGDYAGAIARFEESDRLDPALGTTLNLAACYEQAGRFASAWRTFLRGSEEATALGEERRAQRARELADALRPRLSTLVLLLPEGLPRDTIVKVDEAAIDPQTVATPLPLDGGTHRIAALVPGRPEWSAEVTLAVSHDQATVRVPLLDEAPAPSAPQAAPAPPVDPPNAMLALAPAPPRAPTWSPMRIAGAATAGVGVVAIGFGIGFGAQTGSLWSDRQAQCAGNRCTDRGYALTADARSAATRANVAFIAGGIAVAGGVTLFVLAPRPKATGVELTATALPGGGAFGFSGRFE